MMKIGNPTSNIPSQGAKDTGKYGAIYKQIDALPDGQWLPVSFETAKEAYNFYITAKTHRTRVFEVISRKRTIYVRNIISRGGNSDG